MAAAGNGIQEFLAEVGAKDLARSHRFEVILGTPKCMNGLENSITNALLNIPGVPEASEFLLGQKNTPENNNTAYTSLMCEEAIFPGLVMGAKPFKYNNRVENRATFLDYTGESATFTFLCDKDWKVKKYFDTWMRKIVNPEKRYVGYYEDYTCQIVLNSLDQNDQVTQTWIMEEAWPRAMAPVSLAWSNTQFVRLPITFTFRNWRLQQNLGSRMENVLGGLAGDTYADRGQPLG